MAGFHSCLGLGPGENLVIEVEGAGRRVQARGASISGFTMVEVLVVLTLVSVGVIFTAGLMGTQSHRLRLVGTARELRSFLWQARAEAISSGQPVVVQFDTTTNVVTEFRDYSANPGFPHTVALAAGDGNGVQNTYVPASDSEPTLRTYTLPPQVVFRRPGGSPGDANSVAFDGCVPKFGAAPVDDRVIFQPDGSSIAPTAANSQAPVAANDGTYGCLSCKGIYLADSTARDFFRVSVDDSGLGGKVNILKYLSTSGSTAKYGPQPWQWN
jgi:prepilin-type N-terminal cleavage/methylation domain-containing protein